jgi:hypothetical protein
MSNFLSYIIDFAVYKDPLEFRRMFYKVSWNFVDSADDVKKNVPAGLYKAPRINVKFIDSAGLCGLTSKKSVPAELLRDYIRLRGKERSRGTL